MLPKLWPVFLILDIKATAIISDFMHLHKSWDRHTKHIWSSAMNTWKEFLKSLNLLKKYYEHKHFMEDTVFLQDDL